MSKVMIVHPVTEVTVAPHSTVQLYRKARCEGGAGASGEIQSVRADGVPAQPLHPHPLLPAAGQGGASPHRGRVVSKFTFCFLCSVCSFETTGRTDLTADWSQQTCSPCSLVAEAALTPRDLRILTRAEEELAQCRRFARIFPRRDSAKYLR